MARSLSKSLDWPTSLLDDVTSRGSGHTPNKLMPNYWNGGVKWVSLADSSALDNGFIHTTDKEISIEGLRNSSAVLHPKGTVIMSRDAGVGKSAILAEEMAVSQHFIAWRCDGPNQIHNRFLYYWLQLYKREFERQAIGSTIKTIGLPYFKKLKISYPAYAGQRRIAEILFIWDRAIETVEKLIENSQAQKIALMRQLLVAGKHGDRATDWHKVTLGELGTFYSGLTYAPSDVVDTDGLLVLRSSNIQGEEIRFDDNVYVKSDTTVSTRTKKGDVLICVRNGSRSLIGKAAQIGDNAIGLAHGAFMSLFRPKNANFCIHLFRTHRFKKLVSRNLGATINSINTSDMRRFTFRVPPQDQWHQIAAILNSQDRETALLNEQKSKLVSEKRALMQQLLTGKRRVKVQEMAA